MKKVKNTESELDSKAQSTNSSPCTKTPSNIGRTGSLYQETTKDKL